ncbi:GNAT family acetyltransferase [Paenibacillus sp. J23TS9]|uniref:GNAT family N-acetyltransferase n=1 Tax=Paenibacillus sp. J23TS9 TaxID=2807193 RepID=UPI001B25F7DD|nr:GNAT family N-acetyltransferase [Paenibacillus sp. J23TS9]GIP29400.1 GNAT family acetyltransferase [Paenibacillus sp. J23TS9]
MKIQVKALSESDDQSIFEMIEEIGLGENGYTTNFPNHDYEQFKASLPRMIEISKGINLPDGYVPQTIYWMYINDRPVAYGKLRHKLNNKLLEYGGHVGYIVRPSERGKGYGKLFLSELKKSAKNIGIDELLITCDETNLRSRRVIESNGGNLERVHEGICKYWIEL